MSDEEIVKLVQKGNTEEFGEIIDRYQGKLYGYIKNLINQEPDEVEDQVEETFLKAYINIQGCNTDKKFSSWIYRIAHNTAVDFMKKKKVKCQNIEDKEEILVVDQEFFDELEIKKEEKARVTAAIEKLELKYREVILLYFFEDKSYDEISDILRIPVSNVGVLIFRAKDKLKKILLKK